MSKPLQQRQPQQEIVDDDDFEPIVGNPLQIQLENIVQIAKDHFELDFSSTPLSKQVVTVLGDQSAGKSSLINYLFGFNVRVTGAQAIDTQFTIIESVSEQEFIHLCSTDSSTSCYRDEQYMINEYGVNWLHTPIDRLQTDYRKGVLFIELKQISKWKRYKQFYESHMKDVFMKYDSLIKCIIVNEKYVTNTELSDILGKQTEKVDRSADNLDLSTWNVVKYDKDRSTVKDIILIDSPGFNDESVTDIDKFRANIDLLEFFYRQSALVLFLASPSHILSMGNSLHMLQLTVLDPTTRGRMFNEVHQQISSANLTADTNQSSSLLHSVISSCYNALESKVTSLVTSAATMTDEYFNRQKTKDNTVSYKYFGASIYEKLYFVINKADLCTRNPNYVFYEFGCAIGRRFKYLPLPPAHHILLIGLPMEQRYSRITNFSDLETDCRTVIPINQLYTGQLTELEQLLLALREEKHMQNTLINHIQYVFEKIQESYNQHGYYKQWSSSKHFTEAKKICDESCGLSGK